MESSWAQLQTSWTRYWQDSRSEEQPWHYLTKSLFPFNNRAYSLLKFQANTSFIIRVYSAF